ncbi:hypothetical protein [Actinokineospora xionganensis]|uniref:Alpha/beta hydrolase family protein n=1 Tax=Actinokineospora xionganensis TaxID=2684470 RepID=A0ABR7L8D7_9PSEU|nr:hypothetical protein [Actinokineospora xionganensis]MBC6448966.1 hypothetical protein [Actinokineospora xionganensis]
MSTIEIRVHGIGDHDYYSALGRPAVMSSNDRADVVPPPIVPAHELRLVNWSRSSRKLSGGLLWYLAFPFTLANAAGNMGPADGAWVKRLLRASVTAVGVLLSVAAAAWLIVFAETVLKVVPAPDDTRTFARVISFGIPCALAATMVVRAKWRGLGIRRVVLWLNVLAVVGFGTWVALTLPAQRLYAGWPSRDICPQRGAVQCSLPEERLDAMAAIVAVTTVATLLIVVLLMVLRLFTDAKASVAGAAALLAVAMVSTHAFSAVLRMGIDWISAWASPVASGRLDTLTAWDRALMAYYDKGTVVSSRLDYIAVFGVMAAAALVAAAVVAIRVKRQEPPRTLVDTVTARLGLILLGTLVFAVAFSAPLVAAREWLLTGGPGEVAVRLIHVLTVATVLAVFLRHRLPALSRVMGRFADIVGFWPVEHHPLGGVSYRKSTLAGVAHAVGDAERVVLVGHSQGSVVCAWWLAKHDGPLPRVSLVTCGSPLHSLYRTYFPCHFTEAFFATVVERSPDWKNFWRPTDPIASPLPEADNTELDDPLALGHSDYWIDQAQTTWISERLLAELADADGV